MHPKYIQPNKAGYDFVLVPQENFSQAYFIPKPRMPKQLTTDKRSLTKIGGFGSMALPELANAKLLDNYYVQTKSEAPVLIAFNNPRHAGQKSLEAILQVSSSYIHTPRFGDQIDLRIPSRSNITISSPETEDYCVPFSLSVLRLIYQLTPGAQTAYARIPGDEVCFQFLSIL